MNNYLRKINFITLPRKYLNYIFICCLILQMILYSNEYINLENRIFYPSGVPENQIGFWADILFYTWLVLITFVPLKKRWLLLSFNILMSINEEIITSYVVEKIPLHDMALSLMNIYYKYYFFNFAEYPFIYLERMFTDILLLIFATSFMCILTVVLQVIFFLIKEFTLKLV